MPWPRDTPCSASSLVTGLLDGPRRAEEVTRTRVSVHYETGDARVPVLTVCTPAAVLLPAAVVTRTLPTPGSVWLERGRLTQARKHWRVARWWRPIRPSGLAAPSQDLGLLCPSAVRDIGVPAPPSTYDGLRPSELVGIGPGLTPSGDDLLAGALVAARATADPRQLRWRAATLDALLDVRTTAVSRALLHHACDGYATPELAGFLTAVCDGGDVASASTRLLAVGHVSGAALMAGALHALTTRRLEGAA